MEGRNELLKKAIDENGKTIQTIVAIEEMAELTKELTKNLRGADNREAIIEELADVFIVWEQIQIMHDVTLPEMVAMVNIKCERLENYLNEFV